MTGLVEGNIAAPQTETYLSSHYLDLAISSLRIRSSSDTSSDNDSITPLLFRDDASLYSSHDSICPPPRHPGRSANSGPRNLASKRYLALTQVKSTGHSLMPGPQAPRLHITDETIVPVCVKLQNGQSEKKRRRRSIALRLREQALGRGPSTDNLKVIQMPRGEYLKYFAKDWAGNYIGTEPYHAWTADELEEAYGQYRVFLVGTPRSTTAPTDVHERCGGGAGLNDDGASKRSSAPSKM